jgi:hypothetical protein
LDAFRKGLRLQVSELWIPAAVLDELSAHPDRVARGAIRSAFKEKWIKTAVARDPACSTCSDHHSTLRLGFIQD